MPGTVAHLDRMSSTAAGALRRTRSAGQQSGDTQAGQKRPAPDGGEGLAKKVQRGGGSASASSHHGEPRVGEGAHRRRGGGGSGGGAAAAAAAAAQSPRRRGSGGGGAEHGQQTNPQWPDIKDGKKDAQTVVEALVKYHGAHPDVDERDHIGASPLHLSVLYSKSRGTQPLQQNKSNSRALGWEEREEHEQYARCIWANDALRHLRTVRYDRGDYEGENALHLAIGKRNGALVKFFLERCSEQEKRMLVNARVTGSFDIAHFTTGDGAKQLKRCRFGEHPIAWAACTNQSEIVDLLLEHEAEADCRTLHGDTILHLLVRWSGWLQEDKADSGGLEDDQDENTEWLTKMFDKFLVILSQKVWWGR